MMFELFLDSSPYLIGRCFFAFAIVDARDEKTEYYGAHHRRIMGTLYRGFFVRTRTYNR